MELFAILLISICGGVGLFAGIWLLVTSLLRTMARMSRTLDIDPGRLLRESSWGSGSVNGVRARGCLRVAEYESGWIVRIAGIFGGGKLWLPKSGAIISEPESGSLLFPRSRTIVRGKDNVRLFGGLADFVTQGFPGKAT